MLRVTKCLAESARIGRCASVLLRFVANAARGDLPARSGFAPGRVTGVALAMCRWPRWYGQRGAAIQGPVVTGYATSLGPSRARHVLGVIELKIKALFEILGETLQWRFAAAHVRVADRAHLRTRCQELVSVTVDAGRMIREDRSDRIVCGALVTVGTTKRSMLRTAVFESRVILIITLHVG